MCEQSSRVQPTKCEGERRLSLPVQSVFQKLLAEKKEAQLKRFYNLFRYKSIYLFSAEAVNIMRANECLQARPDDVIVSGYLRSGTTWTQAIVQLILYNDISPVRAFGMDNSGRWSALHRVRKEVIDQKPSTRLLKAHMPMHLLPVSFLKKHCKIIYIYRNVKDVMVSLFYAAKGNPEYRYTSPQDDFDAFVELFMTGKVVFGSYFSHIASAWIYRTNSNFLFLNYDSILTDPEGNIIRIAEFLGKSLSVDQLAHVAKASSFDEMKKWDTTQDNSSWTFLHNGKSGAWRSHFTSEVLLRRVDDWIATQTSSKELEGFCF
ncbi:putative Sulfotransferase family cytosolic 1B member 1 [Hypsibius exemplaris]|uniref:Sulfotransferase family cytosolic 1B member 1 n=1 Tax=Hypsibius exemplaris TaxID=2072580 RepID=A0A1W0WHB6_HYPEX|nr:putative Sulfotransferase family cytosolic 1B member 1 [Hypsibius exemplaris]